MKNLIHKLHLPNWLVGILALVLLLRIPSFFEPYYHGDEMIYLTLGQGIRQGLTLYSQIFDNKPPLLYLTAAIAGNLFWFKVILTFWSLATVVTFWKLAKGKIATLIFALAITFPPLEGNTVNAELFMIFPTLLAFYFLLSKNLTPNLLILSGALFGIATLFKMPAAFDLPIIIVYWFFTKQKNLIKNSAYLFFGFFSPIVLTFIWYFFAGALPEYFRAAFLQNIGYLGSMKPSINIPFFVRGAVLLAGLATIYSFRKKLSNNFILFCVWTLFSLFAVALSQRPYPHYLIQVAAPASFLLSMFFTEKNREQAFAVIPLTLIFFVPFFYKFYNYGTFAYYQRFVNFAVGKTNKDAYFKSFSVETPRNYEIANFLATSSSTNERVFVWDSDAPTIYALSRRLPPIKFTAPYHVADYSNKREVSKEINQNLPRFIVLTDKFPLPEIMNLIREKYILIAQIDDANIYSKISGVAF